jgi:GST-like protein
MATLRSKLARSLRHASRGASIAPLELHSLRHASGGASIAPLELHYTPTPNGWKITLLLEEASLPYTVVPVDLAKGDQFKEPFLELSPNGRMPALIDPNHDDVSVFESGAIMLHIAEKYEAAKQFLPTAQRAESIQWLFWVNAGLGPMAGQCSHFQYYAPQVEPSADHSYALDRYKREYDRLISVLDRRVGETGGFLAGDDYGIADSTHAAGLLACIPFSRCSHPHRPAR